MTFSETIENAFNELKKIFDENMIVYERRIIKIKTHKNETRVIVRLKIHIQNLFYYTHTFDLNYLMLKKINLKH